MTQKDKEFIYEVYKSYYDDNGFLIKDELPLGVYSETTSARNQQIIKIRNEIGQKYVMLNKIE